MVRCRKSGSVAGPIAARILEQCLAMDQGNYKPELAFLAPARNANPFAVIESLPEYKDAQKITVNVEEESASAREPSAANVDLHGGKARPDIRAAADARGKVRGSTKGPNATVAPTPPPAAPRRGFFENIFGRKPAPPAPKPQPGPATKPFNR